MLVRNTNLGQKIVHPAGKDRFSAIIKSQNRFQSIHYLLYLILVTY
jgi:hypothetical protein